MKKGRWHLQLLPEFWQLKTGSYFKDARPACLMYTKSDYHLTGLLLIFVPNELL